MEIEPAEGYVALEFLDDDAVENEQKQDGGPSSVDGYNVAIYAICRGAGKKVTTCKRGDVVLVREYARDNGIDIGDNMRLCEAYCVLGKVKDS